MIKGFPLTHQAQLLPGTLLDTLVTTLQLENLALELSVADAAMFATLFYENPDVLFVIAAGNATEDNDKGLPSPQYLSRFFPNVITVASHGASGALSVSVLSCPSSALVWPCARAACARVSQTSGWIDGLVLIAQ